MMETRKLQLIGGSSYMVSLPKEWVKANELGQGDEIILEVEDKVITLYPKGFKDDLKVSRVEIENLQRYDEKFLRRFIYALYIQGIDEIVITDKNLNPRLIAKISEIVKSLIGIEIIDASEKVVLRCLTVTDFDVYGVVKRMTQIVLTMIHTILDAMAKNDLSALREIRNLEIDSDRLYLLAVRQEHRLIREFSSPARWNELRLILGIRTVAKLIEEILDNLENFSNYVAELRENKEKDILDKFLQQLFDAFEMTSKAYFNSDLELSEDSIQLLEKIEEEMIESIEGSSQYRLGLEALLSACRHIKSIGEIALNKSVRERLKMID
ncbi:MAG: phosphate uptake regulator PhoU [Archaeoglobaceae archaeon]|nr:phosphate uptake regulator PhoU [Archaeoglobaceae archaeon]MDW8118351.1 phosphate uptake regulator PhoU [Archaeoglobaceae archaeon]